MPLYNEGVRGGRGGRRMNCGGVGVRVISIWHWWCLFISVKMENIQNARETGKCVLLCVCICVCMLVCVCILYNFLLFLPLLLLLFVSLVFCFALFWQPGDIDSSSSSSRGSLSWVPHHHLAARILAPALWTLVSFFATTATSLTYMKKRLITHRDACRWVSEWFCMLSQFFAIFRCFCFFISIQFFSVSLRFAILPISLCVALWKYLNSKLQPIKQFFNPEASIRAILSLDFGATFAQVA